MVQVASDILQRLRQLRDYDSLVQLFVDLGYMYSGEERSTVGWPAAVRESVQDIRLAARHGDFVVYYVRTLDSRMLAWERQIVTRVLKTEPHALFVFTNPAQRLWHFVHVRYDEQAERRRQLRRFVVDLGDPRRAERLRTTAERIAKLVILPGEQLTAAQVQDRCDVAFRVSEISNKFLRDFRRIISDLTDKLRAHNPVLLPSDAKALEQSQLLMDRLVFLYFVQKKGWLNGELDYLYSRFQARHREAPAADTYYREHLVPLFKALSHRNAPRPIGPAGEEALPFLNGGLFDLPLSHGTANPSTDESLRIPNEVLFPVFEDFLEEYNFTVSEDSPLDVEVAINPEVIGTIFETFVLTAENEPETIAPDRRKATGSYYTPRVVVHFICRAVLRRYLAERTGIDEQVIKTLIDHDPADQLDDDQLAALRATITEQQARSLREWTVKVRACDPAVGSGAFPVGLLQEMVKLIALLDVRLHGRAEIQRRNYAYDLKTEIIENCLYGVDIQEQAARICELRLWLSLVVDYQVDDSLPLHQRIAGVQPLPNLTFRIRVGDALLDQIFGLDWDVTAPRHQELMNDIKGVKDTYFSSQSPDGKRDLERRVLQLQFELLDRLLVDQSESIQATAMLSPEFSTRKQAKELEERQQRLQTIASLRATARERRAEVLRAIADSSADSRRFDAIRQKLGVSFAWSLDFAEVFDPERATGDDRAPGFDIIVGNPPFVTARNPDKRERYRKRWPVSTFKKYHMLAPFIELALTKLLRPNGQFSYIVSNAFATRDFGKPLIETVFNRIELQNVVDCSGLNFPGHGTPTCILLGYALAGGRTASLSTLLSGTKLGMGQPREEAEETELWREIEEGWESQNYDGKHQATAEWRPESVRRHPWTLDASGASLKLVIETSPSVFRALLGSDVGVMSMTNQDEIFSGSTGFFRRTGLSLGELLPFAIGEEVRDYSWLPSDLAFFPYDGSLDLKPFATLSDEAKAFLSKFRKPLGERATFGGGTYNSDGKPWWGWHQIDRLKYREVHRSVTFPFIGTHFHATQVPIAAHCRTVMSFLARQEVSDNRAVSTVELLSLLNSSAALFWLKQICYNKGAGDDAERDRYEFAGGKVEQLPVPDGLLNDTALRWRAERFAERCATLGALVPGLHPRKLFEQPGEAYTDWYRQIRGYQLPHTELQRDWQSAPELLAAWEDAQSKTSALRREMVALQEEMDWLMYAAYGLLPEDDPAVNLHGPEQLWPVDQLERPYRLRQHDKDIPGGWPARQRVLWEARLRAMDENPNIAQIEQPAYKRRWVEPFDDGDFLAAYEWWLREKAEWLLEHNHGGGPVSLDVWAMELRQDPRVAAAYEAALAIGDASGDKQYATERKKGDFTTHLRRVIEEETVPDDRAAFRKKHEQFRGIDPKRHLPNGVPRERFRLVTARKGYYVWAGKDLWGGVKGDVWDV